MEAKEAKKQGCAVASYAVAKQDLPLCCPLTEQRLWDAHPRVYLPIEEAKEAKNYIECPYCGTKYYLIDN